MIDINELRRLALDGDLAAMQEIILRLEAAEKERDAYKSAYADWTAKTEWLQDEINSGKLPAKYLGMHRADGIKVEIDALRSKVEAMEIGKREISEASNVAKRRLSALADENIALQAKIVEMGRQAPVAWLHETRRDSDVVTDAVKHVWGKVAVGAMAAYSIPLYALPGAQGEEK